MDEMAKLSSYVPPPVGVQVLQSFGRKRKKMAAFCRRTFPKRRTYAQSSFMWCLYSALHPSPGATLFLRIVLPTRLISSPHSFGRLFITGKFSRRMHFASSQLL